MADITEDLLQTLAAGDPIAMLLVATAGDPMGRELRAIAAELLAARNKIRADEEHLPTIGRLTQDLHETEQELRAARARIAKLEQEPPMALVDFGVGFNWKGLHEDMQRLRAERDALRAQLHADDQRAWETLGKPEGTHDTTNVQRLCAEVERLRGIIDDIESESGHCHFLDDEEHEPPHLPDHVRDIVQARDAARADLREAMELLRAHGHPPTWLDLGEAADWNTRYGKLLKKHKERP